MLIQTYQSDRCQYLAGAHESLDHIVAVLFSDDGNYNIVYFSYIDPPHGYNGFGFGVFVWRVDSSSGAFVDRRMVGGLGLLDELFVSAGTRSRSGSLYIVSNWGTSGVMYPYSPSTATATGVGALSAGHFSGINGFFTFPCVDEVQDLFVDVIWASSKQLGVWKLSTGALQYQVQLPNDVLCMALQDENRVWILFDSRVLVLFDYVHSIVLGAVRVPITGNGTKMGWDSSLSRLVFMDKLPDGIDGSCEDLVRGFRSIPVPTRLTTPIPLQTPRKGETVRVMANLVGDTNEPVGGALLNAAVTGSAVLQGIPFTDSYGRSFAKLQCNATGDVDIACSATVPDYVDYGG